jgi:hypothetical protein
MNEKLKFLIGTICLWLALTITAIMIGGYVAKTLVPASGIGVYARINEMSNMTDVYVLVLSFGMMCWAAWHVHELKREIALFKQAARQS